MKKKSPAVRRKRKPAAEQPAKRSSKLHPEPVSLVPAIPEKPESALPVVFQTCAEHPDISYRIGGFCERCYAEQTTARVKALDDAIDEQVVSQVGNLITRIIASDDVAVVERFLGRVMARFERPKQMEVHGTLRAVHLHAPVDFGKKE